MTKNCLNFKPKTELDKMLLMASVNQVQSIYILNLKKSNKIKIKLKYVGRSVTHFIYKSIKRTQ